MRTDVQHIQGNSRQSGLSGLSGLASPEKGGSKPDTLIDVHLSFAQKSPGKPRKTSEKGVSCSCHGRTCQTLPSDETGDGPEK